MLMKMSGAARKGWNLGYVDVAIDLAANSIREDVLCVCVCVQDGSFFDIFHYFLWEAK